jgi:hypothetical protein
LHRVVALGWGVRGWVYVAAMLVAADARADTDADADADADPDPGPGFVLRFEWGNDLFSELPPADDSGFTNDFAFEARWRVARGEPWVYGRHRMITEQPRLSLTDFQRRRWDQVELFGGFTIRRTAGRGRVTAHARTGKSAGGNFGGLALQNRWHRLSRTGATVDDGLQNDYQGGRRVAAVVGGGVELEELRRRWQPFLRADAQAALGPTGLSAVAVGGGLRFDVGLWRARLRLDVELAIARYATRDENLELPGGYGTGAWQLEPRFGIGARAGRYGFGWQYRANEGGSAEPIGVLWFLLER